MAIIKLGFKKGQFLVVMDPDETQVLEWFIVEELDTEPNIGIVMRDSEGRRFVSTGEPFWIHKNVQVLPPFDTRVICTEFGYAVVFKIWVQEKLRVHRPDFLKRRKPELYALMPEEVK